MEYLDKKKQKQKTNYFCFKNIIVC